ncbi:type IV secretion system protein [Cupriavidus agavae]|uniref:TrbL/VirB6 plasmid conjugal transfer protein n=1 Tax=Cupriavidus agavae TaxID=1001822 RepID=A0A4Q7RST3_9BURK|nr:type IV secretion system protein [Cupriavidus agavae]RZT35422.1 TrbL/VirB6 plasmid conjugal transfer protein [Cupriavidus agavae]
MMRIARFILLLLTALVLHSPGAFAQASGPATGTETAQPSPAEGQGQTGLFAQPGSIGESLKSWLNQFESFRTGLIGGATTLSRSLTSEADKIAFGLAVVTLTLAGIRFAATSDPVSAWTEVFETLLMLGIFASLYTGYDKFGPGIYEYFQKLADKVAGTQAMTPAMTLASVGAGFIDSYLESMKAASGISDVLKILFAGILLVAAFVLCAIASMLYTFFIALGEIAAAIGIVIGPIAVALGFSDYSRRYFTSWLDFMIGASMYSVVAAIMARLVSSALVSTLSEQQSVGTATLSGAAYAMSVALFMILVAFELPKIAGAIFGSGGGISGGGVMRVGLKAAGGIGKFLAKSK